MKAIWLWNYDSKECLTYPGLVVLLSLFQVGKNIFSTLKPLLLWSLKEQTSVPDKLLVLGQILGKHAYRGEKNWIRVHNCQCYFQRKQFSISNMKLQTHYLRISVGFFFGAKVVRIKLVWMWEISWIFLNSSWTNWNHVISFEDNISSGDLVILGTSSHCQTNWTVQPRKVLV